MIEVGEARKRLRALIERARKHATERREAQERLAREFAIFKDRVAAPTFRTFAVALKGEGYAFRVSAPAESVRLVSERSPDDYVEITLETMDEGPVAVGRVHRTRGRRILTSEAPLDSKALAEITEEDVLQFLLRVIEPFVER